MNQDYNDHWRSAIRIAMSYGIKSSSNLVKTYATRYGLTHEMLEILEQEAKEDASMSRRCYKCDGSGICSRFADYLALCDCLNASRYKTIGAIMNNSL
jgi:hypothetical protein